MKSIILLFSFFIIYGAVQAQPSTEIYLFDLKKEGSSYKISNPINISKNEGYDNQPHFLLNGSGLLYASNKNGQTDVVKYFIKSGESKQITFSKGSEFSPTPHPSESFFTTIILEKDGTQLLWQYPIDGGEPKVIIPNAKVGYHCWPNDHTIVSFVLGDTATLEAFDVKSGKIKLLDKNIGRSLHKIPGSELVSYVSKSSASWMIKSMDIKSGVSKNIAPTLEQVEDMAWSEDGTIFMGKGDKLFQYDTRGNIEWVEIASLEQYGLRNISRISVSPSNDKIAIVIDQ